MRKSGSNLLVNMSVIAAVSVQLAAGCAKKEKDPLDDIRALVPTVEERLNKRDLGGLKKLGTIKFESNAFVIDIFGDNVGDSVDLAVQRINHTPPEATVFLDMSLQGSGAKIGELRLHLQGNGRWEIDSYQVIRPLNGTGVPDSM